jgi:hypothetical protein
MRRVAFHPLRSYSILNTKMRGYTHCQLQLRDKNMAWIMRILMLGPHIGCLGSFEWAFSTDVC